MSDKDTCTICKQTVYLKKDDWSFTGKDSVAHDDCIDQVREEDWKTEKAAAEEHKENEARNYEAWQEREAEQNGF